MKRRSSRSAYLALICTILLLIKAVGAFVGPQETLKSHENKLAKGGRTWKTVSEVMPPKLTVSVAEVGESQYTDVFLILGQSCRPERMFISDTGQLICIGPQQGATTEGAVRVFNRDSTSNGMKWALPAWQICPDARWAYPWERRRESVSNNATQVWFQDASFDGRFLKLTTTGFYDYLIDTNNLAIVSRSINYWTALRWTLLLLLSVPIFQYVYQLSISFIHGWRANHWHAQNRCRNCGYPKDYIIHGRCPECGLSFEKGAQVVSK